MNETAKRIAEGRREVARLRPHRVRNYRVKFRDGYRCTSEGCSTNGRLLVVKVGRGEDDEAFTTRCQRHLEGKVSPGQWVDR